MSDIFKNLEKYQEILNFIEKKISEKEFENDFKKVQKIDLKHYTKILTIQDLKECILEYKSKEYIKNDLQML